MNPIRRDQLLLSVIATLFLQFSALTFASARVIGQWPPTPGGLAFNLIANDNTLFAQSTAGVALFDFTEPRQLRRISTLPFFQGSQTYRIAGTNLLWFTSRGWKLIDLQSRTNPGILSESPGLSRSPPSVAVSWPYVYVRGNVPFPPQMQLLDFTNPTEPRTTSLYDLFPLAAYGNFLFARATNSTTRTYYLFDITKPEQPASLGSLDLPSWMDGINAYFLASNRVETAVLSKSGFGGDTSWFHIGAWVGPASARLGRIRVANHLALIADSTQPSLFILDVKDPRNPVLVGEVHRDAFEGSFQPTGGFTQSAGLWFVADGTKLKTLDLTNPATPKTLAETSMGPDVRAVAKVGDYLCLQQPHDSTAILDVRNPQRPIQTAHALPPAEALASIGDDLYLIDQASIIHLYQSPALSNSVAQTVLPLADSHPILKAAENGPLVGSSNRVSILDKSLQIAATLTFDGVITDIFSTPNRLYVTLNGIDGGCLTIFDITDPSNPTKLVAMTNTLPFYTVVVAADAAYIQQNDGILILDISDLSAPIEKGKYPLNIPGMLRLGGSDRLYISQGNSIHALDIRSPFGPSLLETLNPSVFFSDYIAEGNFVFWAASTTGVVIGQFATEKPTAPTLEIYPEGETHRIRWLTDIPDFTLFSSPGPSGPWSPETLGYSPTQLFNEVTFPSQASGRFYQLKRNLVTP